MALTSILELGMSMTKDETASDEAKADRARKIEAIIDQTLVFVEKMLLARLDVPVRPVDENTPEYQAYLRSVQAAISKEIYSETDDILSLTDINIVGNQSAVDAVVIRVTAYNLALGMFSNADKEINSTLGKIILGAILANLNKDI